MSEQELLKNKLIKHMIYNMIAFAIIFSVFGAFVFFMVSIITFSSVDRELYDSKERIESANTFEFPRVTNNTGFILKSEIPKTRQSTFLTENILEDSKVIMKAVASPRIILIVRDTNSEIINHNDLGMIGQFTDNIYFNSEKVNEIYGIRINDKYEYRGINILSDSKGEYIQLLINVDSEVYLIRSYFKIISSAVLLGIVLSIIASYILSKKTLTPIQETVIKQTEFVQNASHELRTPLTIIQAKQELLLQEPNAKIIDKSEDIVLTLEETKRLTKLTKDLMILARADSENMKLQKESTNIDELIENLVKPYIDVAEMQEKKIILNLNCKNDISIDTNRIYQLMIILLDNAIKYTENNETIEIATYMKDNKCIIEVKDTGIGISDEGTKRIFERFYREDAARSRETGGSGLGLSIAKIIVSSHGGSIKASHNKPKGTIFTIKLPK